ncbi:MAG: hypothetical protein MO846_00240 [Candidatus Devosia symbiotica]|nr:hypothetical protein [Candidatus Devosia symbiotica]
MTTVETADGSGAEAGTTDTSIEMLVRIIKNDQSRAALIARLQQVDAGKPVTVEAAPIDLSIMRQLAKYTRTAAEGRLLLSIRWAKCLPLFRAALAALAERVARICPPS